VWTTHPHTMDKLFRTHESWIEPQTDWCDGTLYMNGGIIMVSQ